jgi:SAM-dependent methyltransferase
LTDEGSTAERIIECERQIRDEEAGAYGAHRALDRYDREVEKEWMLAALHPPPKVVLDAGCGTGQHLDTLLQVTDKVIAVDHSLASLELAAAGVPEPDAERVEFYVADLRRLPIADATVDAVISIGVVQHIPTAAARLDALRELLRVLRPGGRIVVIVYRWRGHIRRHREGFFANGLYRYAFTARELRAAFADAGFDRVRVDGAVLAPALARRIGMSARTQRRLGAVSALRPLAHHLAVTASRPPA